MGISVDEFHELFDRFEREAEHLELRDNLTQ